MNSEAVCAAFKPHQAPELTHFVLTGQTELTNVYQQKWLIRSTGR